MIARLDVLPALVLFVLCSLLQARVSMPELWAFDNTLHS